MGINLIKLTPAPWAARCGDYDSSVFCGSVNPLDAYHSFNLPHSTDAEFIALARNAFEVMMRQGWGVGGDGEGRFWPVCQRYGHVLRDDDASRDETGDLPDWPDPFTALVEADLWYRQNMEKQS